MLAPVKEAPPMEVAKSVAAFLRNRFGASRVLLFGSLATGRYIPGVSDIDIYFEGIPRFKVDEVTGWLMCAFPSNFLDLWPDVRCEPKFRERVLETSLPL
jgi:predicted nucleotidyltransferase